MTSSDMFTKITEDKLTHVIEYNESVDTWQYCKGGVSIFCDDYEIDWNESRVENDLYLKNGGYIVAKIEL